MTNGVSVKICGLTTCADAEQAHACGADYLGFIQHPKSPRYLPLEKFCAMSADLPPIKKVGVVVYSSLAELERYKDAPFDFIQLHFFNDTPFFEAALWTDIIPPQRLWLAPRVPPGMDLDLAFLPLADTFVLDTYDAERAGGTGHTGDWNAFRRLRELYQRINWILAGGLRPENVVEALAKTRAKAVDINSGIETAPGVKDHARMRALFDALRSGPAAT